jgi:cobalt-precorrin 5A hydrolase
MRTAFITLSREGATLFPRLEAGLGEIDFFLQESVSPVRGAKAFAKIQDLIVEIFSEYRALVFAVPCGVVVRALARCVRNKKTDPAVVVLDVGARWCVSLLSGHEGGANDLAVRISNLLGSEPVITTTTEAVKNVIVGIGCRRGVPACQIVTAIRAALDQTGIALTQVRLLASADIKADEPGLREAAAQLGLPLRLIASEEIRKCGREFAHSKFVERHVGVPAVAEPAALLAGRRTRLFLPKTVFQKVTVAIAEEYCTWSESDRAIRLTAPGAPNKPSEGVK